MRINTDTLSGGPAGNIKCTAPKECQVQTIGMGDTVKGLYDLDVAYYSRLFNVDLAAAFEKAVAGGGTTRRRRQLQALDPAERAQWEWRPWRRLAVSP